jgi:hypothetical protein
MHAMALAVDESFLLFQEGIDLCLARAAKPQRDSDWINASAIAFSTGTGPFGFL